MIEKVESAIIEHGLAAFHNEAGISLRVFLQLLRLYLRSLLVEFQGNVYNQTTGVCIGSAVAPVLSDLYLSAVDVAVIAEMTRRLNS